MGNLQHNKILLQAGPCYHDMVLDPCFDPKCKSNNAESVYNVAYDVSVVRLDSLILLKPRLLNLDF